MNSTAYVYDPDNKKRLVHYIATKLGQISMAKVLAELLMPYEIRVNCVSPGLVKT